MRIRSVKLRQFKRFTDLTISGLTENHRLVVLVGPNGSGKSSLLEAFNTCVVAMDQIPWFDRSYHLKPETGIDSDILDLERKNREHLQFQEVLRSISIDFYSLAAPKWLETDAASWERRAFYLRGSTRTSPEHGSSGIQSLKELHNLKPQAQVLVGVDSRVNHNYQRLVNHAVMTYANPGTHTNVEVAAEATRLLRQLQESVKRVFDGLQLEGLGDPNSQGTFSFRKGRSGKWRFKNLSAGEKSAFDLLLDFIIQREDRKETIFCIDEPELHMHTELQARLLMEILEHMPHDWQLWIATHSIGMMRQARAWAEHHPQEVAFLSFGDRDFDNTTEIAPEIPTRRFWQKTFAVAIGDLTELVIPRQIIFCEGGRHRDGQFDARCFRIIFENEMADAEFVSLGSADEVEKNSVLLSSVLHGLAPKVKTWKLIDRDDRSVEEVTQLEKAGTRVLRRRHLESYLYDDEILQKLCESCGQADAIQAVIKAKQDALDASIANGNPKDDLKSPRGPIYVAIKRILNFTQCGNTSEAFCVQCIAPLITPDSAIYKELRADIFGS